jgi:mannose/fructose/N-acetylgalactosamine-specific phosphotransferase system component IIC
MADRYAEEANTKGILRAAWLWPVLFYIPLRALPVAVATYYGEGVVSALMASIPKWILHGLEITGGMLPALGFAITMMVIGRKNLIPYFIAGFFLVQYAKIPTMAAAIFGGVLAFLHIQFTAKTVQGGAQ